MYTDLSNMKLYYAIEKAMQNLGSVANDLESVSNDSDHLAGNRAADWVEAIAKAQSAVDLPELFATMAEQRDSARNEITTRIAARQARIAEMRANGTLATEKQVAYLQKLGYGRVSDDMTKKEASEAIDRLVSKRDAYWANRRAVQVA